ncbi:dihydrodipicolinate synthase family protein [Actinobaculum sp. 352]|uniref:dihydrodipicolinate synthase family protein n=1 Tax=Actinobaculum sp. 352 TaxID=2490946 RepID=UPI000F7ED304|nr:dihydrodipicolinate synthase family protein [Actinobaculum sp. 352]RTE49874.1 dihydrodipicolinate synthase family protein [Actinobaculum sp. 352]
MQHKLGYITPVITAFTDDGTLDEAANRAVHDFLIDGGVDGLLLLGSIGEFYAIPHEEQRRLIDLATAHVAGRTHLLVGTGCNSVTETIEMSHYALEAGADGVVVIAPYYFQLSPEDLYHHFDAVATAVTGSIYLYNFPGCTGNPLSAALVRRLAADHPNIVGIKDTLPEMSHTRELIDTILPNRPEFQIYSGLDENFAHNALAGGSGCIAGLSNIYPEVCAAWAKSCRDQDWEASARLQHIIDTLAPLYNITPNFTPILKYAMAWRGVPVAQACRTSCAPLNEAQKQAVDAILQRATALIAEAGLRLLPATRPL